MISEYAIPLFFKEGKFGFNELAASDKNALSLYVDECSVLSYNVPKYGTQARLYDIDAQQILNNLYATYNDNGELQYAELIDNNDVILLYINLNDNDTAKQEISDFAIQSADIISDELRKCKNEAARLFIEYFYDGEAVDFAAKIGTTADKQALLNSLSDKARKRGLEETVIDNCGDYPFENRIECDSITLGTMLQCADPEIRSELFYLAVEIMTKNIKDSVIDVIDKSDDFKFIAKEYD